MFNKRLHINGWLTWKSSEEYWLVTGIACVIIFESCLKTGYLAKSVTFIEKRLSEDY